MEKQCEGIGQPVSTDLQVIHNIVYLNYYYKLLPLCDNCFVYNFIFINEFK